jgi:hypothetical protein
LVGRLGSLFSVARLPGVELLPRQQVTLEVASSIVLSVLCLGVWIGGWSSWSVVPAIVGYCAWVVTYAEATVQVDLWRARRLSAQATATPGCKQQTTGP